MIDQASIRAAASSVCLTILLLTVVPVLPAWAQERPAGNSNEPPASEKIEPGTPPSILELIPDDAALAIGIPNLARLTERGDRLLSATNTQMFRLSESFLWLYEWIGAKGLIDESRPAAAVVGNLTESGLDEDSWIFDGIVFRFPVKDPSEAARRFKLDDDAITAGRIVPAETGGPSLVCLRNGYLTLGWNKQAMESVLDSEPLSAALSPERRQAASDADLLVLVGTQPWGAGWDEFVKRLESDEFTLDQVPAEQQAAAREFLRKTVPDARFVLLTAAIDDGVHLRLAAQFKTGGSAEAALQHARGGAEGGARLADLPEGRLIGAVAARGEELRTITTARLLVPLVLEIVARHELLGKTDPARMLGTFDAVWRQLAGAQLALYATGATTQTEISDRGSVAGIFVLETADPQQLVESLAAEGITLGGRTTDENGEPRPRLVLRHLPNRETLAGHAVDHLEIDAGNIDPDTAAALREGLGPAWIILRVARLDGRAVVLLGSQRRLLEETLASQAAGNRREDGNALEDSEALAQARARLDPAHQAVLHVSLRRTLPALSGLDDGVAAMNSDVSRVTSAALTLERDLLQIELWVPLAELQAIPEKWRSFFY